MSASLSHSFTPAALFPLLFRTAPSVIAISAPIHELGPSLTEWLVELVRQNERVAILVTDNHFDALGIAEIARQQNLDPHRVLQQILVARAETPYQIRQRVRSLVDAPRAITMLWVLGLLESFHDDAIRAQDAQGLLADTLEALKKLSAVQIRVLVTLAPAARLNRPYLHTRLVNTIDTYIEPVPPLLPKSEQLRLC